MKRPNLANLQQLHEVRVMHAPMRVWIARVVAAKRRGHRLTSEKSHYRLHYIVNPCTGRAYYAVDVQPTDYHTPTRWTADTLPELLRFLGDHG